VPSKLLNWAGDTVLVLASGPSLREFIRTGSILHGKLRTIAVNSTIFAAPAADVAFGVDFMWWKTHHRQVARDSRAQPWTTDKSAAERFGLHHVRPVHESGLHPTRVATNGNSGAAAISFAALTGAKRILLLGFDMKLGPQGERHWHPDHPAPCTQAQPFEDWLYKFDAIAREAERQGIEIVNCTPDSAITSFPSVPLEEVLCPAL
jgi:hypothetical protein